MAPLNSIFSIFLKKRLKQIEFFKKHPVEVQEKWLIKLISSAKNSSWGKEYDLSSITNSIQFKERVPLNDYESLKPYINRIREGERNVTWPTDIQWFAKSSGTTNDRSKYIPISKESLHECHFMGGKDMLALYFQNHPDSRLFNGKAIGLGGSLTSFKVNNKIYFDGDLSAILIQNLPFWVEYTRVPQKSIALMDEWESKIEKMALATINSNVTSLSGVPSWTLLLLKKILEKKGGNSILDVWPGLEVFFHGGVNFNPYKNQFANLIPSDEMVYMETYNATEGFFGIQDQLESGEMLLMLDYGIYYEFLPIDQLEKDTPKTVSLSEVEKDVNYAMVISTNTGLWRYLIGDTICFTSLNPFRIQITGRTKNFINAVGEELIVDNAEKALTHACNQCNAQITEYTAAPIYFSGKESAAHEWLIEFEKKPDDLDYFTEVFDNLLRSINSDYDAKRYQNMVLRKPVIKEVPQNTFYNWFKKKGKLGGQNKVPRLSNDRKYIDEICKSLN